MDEPTKIPSTTTVISTTTTTSTTIIPTTTTTTTTIIPTTTTTIIPTTTTTTTTIIPTTSNIDDLQKLVGWGGPVARMSEGHWEGILAGETEEKKVLGVNAALSLKRKALYLKGM